MAAGLSARLRQDHGRQGRARLARQVHQVRQDLRAAGVMAAWSTRLVSPWPVAAVPALATTRFMSPGAARVAWFSGSAGPWAPVRRSWATRSTRYTGSWTAGATWMTDDRWPLDDRRSVVVHVRGHDRVAVAGVRIPVGSPRWVPGVAGAPVRSGLCVSVDDAAQSKSCGHRCRRDDVAGELVHLLCVPDQAMGPPSGTCLPDETSAASLSAGLAGRTRTAIRIRAAPNHGFGVSSLGAVVATRCGDPHSPPRHPSGRRRPDAASPPDPSPPSGRRHPQTGRPHPMRHRSLMGHPRRLRWTHQLHWTRRHRPMRLYPGQGAIVTWGLPELEPRRHRQNELCPERR